MRKVILFQERLDRLSLSMSVSFTLLSLKNITFDLDQKKRAPAFIIDDIKVKQEKYCYLYLLLFGFWRVTFFTVVVSRLFFLLRSILDVGWSITKWHIGLSSRAVRRIASWCRWWSIRSIAVCLGCFGSSRCSGPGTVMGTTQAVDIVEVGDLYRSHGTQKLVEQGKE